jgi:hypothetical protein
MKSLLVVCGLFLALSVTPALADTIGFDNQGIIAASGTGGITALSTLTGISFNGTSIPTGPIGLILFGTGSLVGSLQGGGQFSDGALVLQITDFPAAIFAGNFTGTWSQIGDHLFELLGTFSGDFEGIRFHGSTDQIFRISFSGEEACFRDLNGTTTLTTVPEPCTLALMGTGFVALGGVVRRKFRGTAS